MEAKLIVIGGKANKSEVKLKLPTVIGRSRSADLTVAHPKVSRHHCQIFAREGLLYVRDNGSLNGTFIDGNRVTEGVLKPGDKLTVGPLTFVAVYEAGAVDDPCETPEVKLPPEFASAPEKKTKTGNTAPGTSREVRHKIAQSGSAAPTSPPKVVPKPISPAAATTFSKPAKPLVDHDESMLVDLVPEDDSVAAAPGIGLPVDDSPKAKAGGKIEWLPDVQTEPGKNSDPAADTVDFSWLPGGGQEQPSNLRSAPKLNLTPPVPPTKERLAGDEPPATADFMPRVNAGLAGDVSNERIDESFNWLDEEQAAAGEGKDDFQLNSPNEHGKDRPSPIVNATVSISRDTLPENKSASTDKKRGWGIFGGKKKDPEPAADGVTAQFASPHHAHDLDFELDNGAERMQTSSDSPDSPSKVLRAAAGQAATAPNDDDDLSAFFKTLDD